MVILILGNSQLQKLEMGSEERLRLWSVVLLGGGFMGGFRGCRL